MKCLQLILASVFLGLCYGNYKLNVMCDDYTTIYYNGVKQKSVSGTNHWNALATSAIPKDTREVMIKCVNQNTRWPNGIKAEILNGAGKAVSETGKSWQCSTSASSGFRPASITSVHSNWKSTAGSGAVIWTSSSRHATAYCKVNIAVNGGYGSFGSWSACSAKCGGGKQFRTRKCDKPAPAQGGKPCLGASLESRSCNTAACPPYTLKVMCDDYTTIYLDGVVKKGVAGTGYWNSLATTKIPAATKSVMIKCYNQNTRWPNGIKAQILNAAGKVINDTSKGWQCSTSSNSGFRPATHTSQHSNWKSKLSSGAVIWSSSKSHATAYCRTDLS